MLKSSSAFLFLFLVSLFNAKSQTIIPLQSNKIASFRGLSVVNNKIAWLSGSKGSVGLTKDSGKTWIWNTVKGYETSDFRDIEAMSDKEAVIISSGTPAYILKTKDGGKTWDKKFEQKDTAYFFDAMDFFDSKHGFVLGDPINGKFLLLKTEDGGETWNLASNMPKADRNEAAFAASGTCLRVDKKAIAIVSGGGTSRLIISYDGGRNWNYQILPLTDGSPSRGAFSVAFGKNEGIIVGGDYARNNLKDSTALVVPFKNESNKFTLPAGGPAGFQSSVEYLKGNIYLSTGTSGTNITLNGGKTWRKIDSASYNVCRKSRQGNFILLAGDKGNIGLFKF